MRLKLTALLMFLMQAVSAQNAMDEAVNAFKAGRYDLAKELFEKVVATDAKNVTAIEYLGDIAGRKKNWKTAISQYGKLLRLNPSNANYHYKYGGSLGMLAKESNKFKALGMIGDVRKEFEAAIRLDPKHIDARWALIELNLQLPSIVGGSLKTADRYAGELFKISPVDGYLAKAHIAEYKNEHELAAKNYNQAIRLGSKTAARKLAILQKGKSSKIPENNQ